MFHPPVVLLLSIIFVFYGKDYILPGSDKDEHLRNEGEGTLFHGI